MLSVAGFDIYLGARGASYTMAAAPANGQTLQNARKKINTILHRGADKLPLSKPRGELIAMDAMDFAQFSNFNCASYFT